MADKDKKYYCPVCDTMVKPTGTNNDNCSTCGSKLNKGSYKRHCWQCTKEVTARPPNFFEAINIKEITVSDFKKQFFNEE